MRTALAIEVVPAATYTPAPSTAPLESISMSVNEIEVPA